jgi:MFS family permease
MVVAVGLGVWLSIRMGIEDNGHQTMSFTWWVITRLAFLIPATNLGGFMVYFFQERFEQYQAEMAAAPAAGVATVVGILILLSSLPSGLLADRFGKKPLIVLSAVICAVGAFIVVLIPNLTAIYIGGSLIGIGVGVFYTANWALGTEVVPREQAGRYLGVSNLAGAGAGAIGAYIGGPIADAIGYVPLFGIYALLFLVPALTVRGVTEKVVRPAGK